MSQFSKLSAGLLVIITKIKMNFLKENKIVKKTKNNVKLIYNDLSKKKNKHILIFLINLLDFLGRSLIFFFLIFWL